MKIQNIKSGPDYIMKFIKSNMSKLNEIYKEGINNYKKGALGLKCSKKQNKMDVFFMNEEYINTILQKESWKQLHNSVPENKKLFIVHDNDNNSIFIITV